MHDFFLQFEFGVNIFMRICVQYQSEIQINSKYFWVHAKYYKYKFYFILNFYQQFIECIFFTK